MAKEKKLEIKRIRTKLKTIIWKIRIEWLNWKDIKLLWKDKGQK